MLAAKCPFILFWQVADQFCFSVFVWTRVGSAGLFVAHYIKLRLGNLKVQEFCLHSTNINTSSQQLVLVFGKDRISCPAPSGSPSENQRLWWQALLCRESYFVSWKWLTGRLSYAIFSDALLVWLLWAMSLSLCNSLSWEILIVLLRVSSG